MDSLGRFIAIVLAIVLILLAPLQYVAGTQVETMDHMIEHYTAQFTDTVRKDGSISLEVYEEYIDKISITGELYDIEIEHSSPKTAEDVISENTHPGSLLASADEDYLPSLGEDLFTSFMGASGMIRSFAAHTHTSACYAPCDGDANGDGRILVNDDYAVHTSSWDDIYSDVTVICKKCNKTTYYKEVEDGYGEWETFYPHGNSTVTRCNQVAVSVVATNKSQTLNHGTFIDTATVTFLDGHTEVKKLHSNYDPLRAGVQTVTLSYYGFVGNGTTWGQMSDTVSVNVVVPHTSACFPDYHVHTSECNYLGNTSSTVWMQVRDSTDYAGYTTLQIDVYSSKTTTVGEGVTPSMTIVYGYNQYNSSSAQFGTMNVQLKTWDSTGKKITKNYYKNRWVNSGTIDGVTPYEFNQLCTTAATIVRDKVKNLPKSYPYSGDTSTYITVATSNPFMQVPIIEVPAGGSKAQIMYVDYLGDTNSSNTGFDPNRRSCGYTSNPTPDCNKLESLTVIPDRTSIYYGQSINYTFRVNYSDGTSKPVTSVTTVAALNNTQIGTQTVKFSYTEGGVTLTAQTNITVLAGLGSITPTYTTQTIYKGQTPVLTATATYLDGTTAKTVTPINNFSNTVGTHTVTLTYTEKGATKTATCTVIVKPNVTSLTVAASATTVYDGNKPSFTVKAVYEDNKTKTLTSSQYTESGWSSGSGTKNMSFSYTENGKKVTASVTITVKPNVTRLEVTPSTTTVYNGAKPTFTVKVVYENSTSRILTSSQYTESDWSSGAGSKTVSFSYVENGKTVSTSVTITVKPNVTSITVTPSTQSIERYKNPSFTVRVNYENGTSVNTTSYTMAGFNNKNLGTQTPTLSYTENGITKTATASVTVTNMTKICSVCGTRYQLDNNDVDQGCPVCKTTIVSISVTPKEVTVYKGESLPIAVKAYFRDGKVTDITGWTSNFDTNKVGVQQVTITYMGIKDYITVIVKPNNKVCPICNETYPLNPDGSDPGCPSCKVEIVYIDVQPKNVTMEIHHPIPITVTAVYRDGHTEQVSDWRTNLIPDKAGVFDVNISYKTKSETIKVTVLSDDINICPYCGLNYSRTEYPMGCPNCAKIIVAIEARLRNGGRQVPVGSDLYLEIVLIYRDEHRTLVYEGYEVSNYYPHQIGEQTVTVHYGSLMTNITIEVINNFATAICVNGHEYYINQDGSDPGCPYCSHSTGEQAILYYETTYTYEILDKLYTHGKYDMKKGDYITVTVTNRKTSLRSHIQSLFIHLVDKEKKMTFGGEVIGGASD